jgi:hypothetical protein
MGALGCLAVFGCLVWLAKRQEGISTLLIVCLLIALIASLFLVAGQVKVVTSLTSGDTEDK